MPASNSKNEPRAPAENPFRPTLAAMAIQAKTGGDSSHLRSPSSALKFWSLVNPQGSDSHRSQDMLLELFLLFML